MTETGGLVTAFSIEDNVPRALGKQVRAAKQVASPQPIDITDKASQSPGIQLLRYTSPGE